MTDYQMDTKKRPEHSPVGPSSIEAIIMCPGRVKLSENLPDHTSFAAAQGTVAHAICEKALKKESLKGYKPGDTVAQDGYDIPIDRDMHDTVAVYTEFINDIRGAYSHLSTKEVIEGEISLDHVGLPEIYGTVDHALSIPFDTLYVTDYKHGTGVLVSPENNPQVMTYALGVAGDLLHTYNKVVLSIVQPRARTGDKIKTWTTTPLEIEAFLTDTLKPAVKTALSGNAHLTPGEKQCQWCKAVSICPEVAKQSMLTAQEDFKTFAEINPTNPDSFTIDQLAQVYKQLPLFKKWIKAVEGRVFGELATGNKIAGFKIVKGRRSRSWQDSAKAEQFLQDTLQDKAFEKKLLSPAKAEKLLDKQGKKEVKKLILVSDGKPSIVKDSDKRAAVSIAADDFKHLI